MLSIQIIIVNIYLKDDFGKFLHLFRFKFNQNEASFGLQFTFFIECQSWRKGWLHFSNRKNISLDRILDIMVNRAKDFNLFNYIRPDRYDCILYTGEESIVKLIHKISL